MPDPAIVVDRLSKTYIVPVRGSGLAAALESLVRRQTRAVEAGRQRSPRRACIVATWLAVAALIAPVAAQSPAVVPYPLDYKTSLMKYAVVDRADGFSRDLYVLPDTLEALRRDPRLSELPVGSLFAIDVYSAKQVGRDRKSQAPIFEATAQGRLVRSKDERTVHLMWKTQAGFGSQNWAFAGFDPLTAEPLRLQLPGDCLLCHQAAVVSDMTFSLSLLKRFATTGEVQYGFCSHPGRQSCRY
jgi:hypothetical protein